MADEKMPIADLWAWLEAQSVKRVVVGFHGGCDDGCIDSIQFDYNDGTKAEFDDVNENAYIERIVEILGDVSFATEGEMIDAALFLDVEEKRATVEGRQMLWCDYESEVDVEEGWCWED